MSISQFITVPLLDKKGRTIDKAVIFEQNPPPDIVIHAGNFYTLNRVGSVYEEAVIVQGYTEQQAADLGYIPRRTAP